MTDTQQFAMPDVGEGLTEADVVRWHVAVGDVVAVNDVIVEVETAKSTVELPSPYAGVVSVLHAAEGDTVEVGAPIISIVGAGVNRAVVAPDPVTDEPRPSVLVGYGPTRAKVARRPRRTVVGSRQPVVDRDGANGRPYATPPVRKLARELGLDLRTVPASGSRGQVTRADLRVAATPTPSTRTPAEVRSPVKGVRKATAEAMVASAFTAPHATEWVTVDVTRSMRLLDRLRADPVFADVRLSPLVLVMRAALLALTRHPDVNAKWDGVTNEIVRYRDVNLGVATATSRGLLVPNISSAQDLSTPELARALRELVTEARDGRTSPERMRGGTFTITNIGVFGVDGGTPILNPGEAAILCMGRVVRQPWEHKGKVALRQMMTLAMSFDHRLIDGALGSQMLAEVAATLERPDRALAL